MTHTVTIPEDVTIFTRLSTNDGVLSETVIEVAYEGGIYGFRMVTPTPEQREQSFLDLDKEVILMLATKMTKLFKCFENYRFNKFVEEVRVWTRQPSNNLNKKYGPESIFGPTSI